MLYVVVDEAKSKIAIYTNPVQGVGCTSNKEHTENIKMQNTNHTK